MNYGEWMVLPDEFPDSAIMMLLGARYYVKEAYENHEKGYKYVIDEGQTNNTARFDLKVLPDFDVPLPDMSDPKDLAIVEMQDRIKELEAQLKRKVR
jgi:hypothetical protein